MPALGKDADIGLVIAHGVELLDDVYAIIIIDCAHRVDDALDILPCDVTAVCYLQTLHTVARLIEELVCHLHVVVFVYKDVQVTILFDDNGLCF